jgi:hypothetical protein
MSKGSSEEELDQILNKVMVLFRYIHGNMTTTEHAQQHEAHILMTNR